jgi:excinuclease ABC subunit C
MASFEEIKSRVGEVPLQPGVYVFLSKDDQIIYVGKAKALKKRLQSYFMKQHDNNKTRVLVSNVFDFRYFVVETEFDALLLENNLIKEHRPRYNILLKDDKSYPWIELTSEYFPRVFLTRNRTDNRSAYFGPYSSVRTAKLLVKLLTDLFKFRTCTLDLAPSKINSGKYKVCLEYHLKRCKGPCVGEQEHADYLIFVDSAKRILKGDLTTVLSSLRELMDGFAENLQFEDAQLVKDKYELLQDYYSKSVVVNPDVGTLDVFFAFFDNASCFVNYMHIVNGAVVHLYNMETKRGYAEDLSDLLPNIVLDIRTKFESTAREILLPIQIDFLETSLVQHIPQRGDKKKLMDMAERNARMFKLEKIKQVARLDPERHVNRVLEQMQSDLQLSELPKHIECFDNSNLQGTNPVAACVVFRDTKPFKKDYRHFNVKTVEGPDDFASMQEIVRRRYKRLLDEGEGLPQLIVVDGGKGQLSVAYNTLVELGVANKIAIIGIAKRLEEIFFPNDSVPLYLDKSSETLKIIQHMRNEAHRFGITFHRNKRSNNFIVSELASIPGIGKHSSTQLMKFFKTISKIKESSLSELAEVVGNKRAALVKSYFEATNAES